MHISVVLYKKLKMFGNRFVDHIASWKDELERYEDFLSDEEDYARNESISFPYKQHLFHDAHTREFPFGYGAQLLVGRDAIAPTPRLILSDALFRELHYYFSTHYAEFQLMGLVEQEASNRFVIKEWVHNPHTAGIGHADLDQGLFPQWLDLLEREGKDIRLLRVQVHSHGMLDAYFSSIDVATIRDAYSCNWMISIVGNRAGTIYARLDVYDPVPLSISMPIVVESLQFLNSDEERNEWQGKRERANEVLTIKQR